ncbi:SpoIIE family protein phosphatase [Micromonospora auratinigra]|uniref:GAF domain-containing protein n=1 Tax=Micromonospora auratinigra TaxID=261654 RepID=A0A1A8Z0Y6_9ACTN|nr:SpoIIE family protein phosphatase [Micromonospora auratinigra]SBT37487.1 GAF domain-containing protein [Micromonospora auratinigra]
MSGTGSEPSGRPDYLRLFRAAPTPYLVLDPDLSVVEINDAALRVTGRSRTELLGKDVFAAFPINPDETAAAGAANLRRSLERARDTGRPDTMPVQRYDLLDAEGRYTERWWSPVTVPLLDEQGRTVLLLHRTRDVTDFMAQRGRSGAGRGGTDRRRRMDETEAELYAHARELRAALDAEALATRRLVTLVDLARQLAGCETLTQVTEVVIDRGLAALGADGGAVAVREGDLLQLTLTDSLGGRTRERHATLPLDGPLPACVAARRDETVLLPDRAAGLGWPDGMAEVFGDTGLERWAALPLRVGERLIGSLTVGWRVGAPFSEREVQLLGAFADQCAQTLDRIRVHRAQQRTSETLQRSLLTAPPATPGLTVGVRYHPAAAHEQVGGDWYDAFPAADGASTVVVGDVTGHDRQALASMAQIRNTLRGVAYLMGASPAAILVALERVLAGLRVDGLASAVLAHVRTPGQPGGDPTRARVVWTNAGHPPPVLIGPDGAARLLATPPDPLIGVRLPRDRVDHELLLAPGSTLVLYTDGLVERRRALLDEGLERLRALAGRLAHLPVEEFCDALLADLVDVPDDDVVLLVLRVDG